ncbi:D-beta-hydroxybutyrate dehydrogenase, mitochondrial-like isoform X2 [Dermacentor variabilis]|uniref:D-beta-hydroxybutyrate dehydrogenase, mitochondrial-like isoform X2 n=1 Tax=Dermacentor variabilis TaxID=34621 RepID=UPI003F5C61D2
MRTSWVLFATLLCALHYVWSRLPFLAVPAQWLGTTLILLCAAHCLARFLWRRLFVTLVNGDGKAVLITVLWAVVANAGIPNSGLIEWMTMESIVKVFDVNVFGVVRVAKKFLPLLKRSKGRMVIVTSVYASYTFPLATAYCMSKYATLSLVDGLRRELYGKGVDVIAIEPTLYKTAINDDVGSMRAIERDLNKQAPEVVADYTETEIKNWLTSASTYYSYSMRDNPQEVVNQMIAAVRETDPKTCYPATGPLEYTSLSILRTLPDEAVDYLILGIRKMINLVC